MALHEYHGLYKEGQRIKGIIQGGKLVWPVQNKPTPPPGPDYTEPFYIEVGDSLSSGTSVTISIVKNNKSARTITIQYSLDRTTWTTLGSTSKTALKYTLTKGVIDKVYFRSNIQTWGGSSGTHYNHIQVNNKYNVGGNTMSLLYGSSFNGSQKTLPSTNYYVFEYLFTGETNLIKADKLLLPAKTLYRYSYRHMFDGCTSLVSAPDLPATTLAQDCYNDMFYGCSVLTSVPSILPATSLAIYCYDGMFYGCKALFKAPDLPAATLQNYCYKNMFYKCSKLKRLKCLATNISATGCTSSWLPSNSGAIFTCASGMTNTWPRTTSGVPSSWKIISV